MATHLVDEEGVTPEGPGVASAEEGGLVNPKPLSGALGAVTLHEGESGEDLGQWVPGVEDEDLAEKRPLVEDNKRPPAGRTRLLRDGAVGHPAPDDQAGGGAGDDGLGKLAGAEEVVELLHGLERLPPGWHHGRVHGRRGDLTSHNLLGEEGLPGQPADGALPEGPEMEGNLLPEDAGNHLDEGRSPGSLGELREGPDETLPHSGKHGLADATVELPVVDGTGSDEEVGRCARTSRHGDEGLRAVWWWRWCVLFVKERRRRRRRRKRRKTRSVVATWIPI